MKKQVIYSWVMSLVLLSITSCYASIPQPVDECSPPANIINQSRSLRLGDASTVFAWSPHGKTLIFSPSSREGLFAVNLEASGSEENPHSLRRITSQVTHEYFDLSEDSTIAFSAKDSSTNQFDMFSISLEGTKADQLTTSSFAESRPAWSPDGKYLAFSRNDGELTRTRIYLLDTATLTENLLVDLPAWDYTWAPDGKWMTFLSHQDGSDDLYIVTADGTNVRKLVNTEGCDDVVSPIWSPNGQMLAFIKKHNFNFALYVIRSDGRNEENLTNSPGNEYQPAWSPTGTKIAYVSFDGVYQDIYTIDVANGNSTHVTDTLDEMESLPQWSPDGQFIAFLSFTPDNQKWHLDVVNLNNNERKRLVTISEALTILDPE